MGSTVWAMYTCVCFICRVYPAYCAYTHVRVWNSTLNSVSVIKVYM